MRKVVVFRVQAVARIARKRDGGGEQKQKAENACCQPDPCCECGVHAYVQSILTFC